MFSINNFDIIRILAACQVVANHAFRYFGVRLPGILGDLVHSFPGVPIFFIISGFLISRSYERCGSVGIYARRRILRIYPALIVCVFLSVVSIILSGYLRGGNFSLLHFAGWILGQITFVQFYNPDFMRGFGTGVMNGSLWTIAVELQFYVLLPVIYGFARLLSQWISLDRLLAFLAVVGIWLYGLNGKLPGVGRNDFIMKLYGVSFVPWLWMFLVGVLMQRRFDDIFRVFGGRFLLVLPAYLGICWVGAGKFGWRMGNQTHPLLFLALAVLVFSAAYTATEKSAKVLANVDLSYGIYIYHIPVFNILLYTGKYSGVSAVLICILTTLALAAFSWYVVERRFVGNRPR